MMTPELKRDVLLASIAAQIDDRMAAMKLSQMRVYLLSDGRVDKNTVNRVRRARNHTIETLVELADALGCDIEVRVKPRTAA